MNWSIINSCNAFQLKRLLNILCNFVIYSKEEIKYITAPIARMVERIVVYDDKVCVEFKSGMTVEV